MNAHGRLGGPKRGKIVHPGDYVSLDGSEALHPDPSLDAAAEIEMPTAEEVLGP